jgi:hypothetical protein
MNYKILGTSVASIALIVALLSSPMFQAIAAPAYTSVTASSVTANSAQTIYKFSATTAGNIPKVADSYINSVLVFGYAWADTSQSPAQAVVVTIHPVANDAVGKDSTQNPNNWHPHTAQLAPTGSCTGIGLGLQVVGLQSPTGGIAINGNTITLTMSANSATVSPSTFNFGAAGFTLVPGSTAGTLCVAGP